MLAAPPARRLLTVLPFAVFLYGCSDPATAPARRIDAKPHTLLASVVTVTNTDDAGPGSLRQAILDAEPGSTIQFDAAIAGQTIGLLTGPLRIDKSLTIEASAATGMTISGRLLDKVIASSGEDVTLRNLSIVDGKSTTPGGGIIASGTLTLDHSLVAHNEVEGKGGGGILLNGDASTLVLLNSTVSENVSLGGGGIFAEGYVVSRNSTIVGNIAQNGGGGLYAQAGASLRNTIIANNVDNGGTDENCIIAADEAAYFGTNISNDATCGVGQNYVIADPVIGPLADNGGPTKTHALLLGSPGIDAGTTCTETSDERYVARPQGSSCDVGAFEFNAFRPVTLTVNPNVAVNPKTGIATVAGTISCDGPAPTPIRVVLSQTQKTTGKFTTIVQATLAIPFTCVSNPTSWSMQLAPATGKFEPGAATGTISTLSVPAGYLPANVVGSLKLFQVK